MVNLSGMINGAAVFLRRDSIKEFAQDNSVLGLNHVTSNIDKQVSEKIKLAYDYIGDLNLLRFNRPDIENNIKENGIRCVSINYIREQINKNFTSGDADFSDSQIEAMQKLRATLTKQVYGSLGLKNSEIQAEGYCGEHAYLLLGALLDQGIPSRNLRVINLEGTDKDRKYELDHSFLVYCSHGFEDNRDIEKVMRVIYSGNKNALFLNPWGVEKIVPLNLCERKEDFFEIFNRMMLEVDNKFDTRSLNVALDISIDTSDDTDSETDISNSGSLYSEDFNETGPHLAQHMSEYVSLEPRRKRTFSDADLSASAEPLQKKPC